MLGVGKTESKAAYILEGRWNGDFRVRIQEKVLLGYVPIGGIYGDHRKAHLQHPGVHDVIDSVRKFNGISINSLWKQTNNYSTILLIETLAKMFKSKDSTEKNMPLADASKGLCRSHSQMQTQSGRSAGWTEKRDKLVTLLWRCLWWTRTWVKVFQVNIVCLHKVLTLSPNLKTSSVRKSDNILRTDAPWGWANTF